MISQKYHGQYMKQSIFFFLPLYFIRQMITALGQVWHPEHFVCVVCTAELGTIGFFEREGKAYCEKDYQHLFSPRCGYCKGPILQVHSFSLDWTVLSPLFNTAQNQLISSLDLLSLGLPHCMLSSLSSLSEHPDSDGPHLAP